MTNVFNFKSRNCLEWTLHSPSRQEYISPIFFLQDIKCNLKFNSNAYYDKFLHCESVQRLKTAVDVRVFLTSSNNGSHSNFAKCKFTGTRQEIWSNIGYDLRGSLTFEVIFFSDVLKERQPSAASGSAVPQVSHTSSYREKVHFQALSKDLSKLLDDDSSCDIAITCDGKTFQAHKIILSARSTVFSAMLKSDMVEGKTGLINVEDIKNPVFESFLRYIYSGTLPELSVEGAVELYKVGDKYAVEQLKLACSEFIAKNLSEGNACDILVLANLHSDEKFRNTVISYILDKRIPQRDKNWSRFCNNHCKLAIEIHNLYMEKYCPL